MSREPAAPASRRQPPSAAPRLRLALSQAATLLRRCCLAIWRRPLLRILFLAILTECLLFQWAAFVPMPSAARDIPAGSRALEGFTGTAGSDPVLTAGPAGPYAVIVRLPEAELRSLYIDADTDRRGPLAFSVSIISRRSAELQEIASGETASGVARSHSLLLWPDSKVTQLRLVFDLEPGQRLYLNRLILNRRIPFAPDGLRLLMLLAAGLLMHLLFSAPLFLRQARPDDLGQRLVITATGAVIVIICFWLAIASASAPFFDISQTSGDLYSRSLTDAVLRGRTDLLTDPPTALATLANPYDPAQRAAIPAEDLIWDAAWFNGRYYVSYGIVPVLALYAPFRALTGYYLQTAWAVCLFGAFGTLLLFLILRRLFLILFPRLAFRWHFVACLAVSAASFTGWGLARPKFYEAASLGGFLFLMLAAGQILRAACGRSGAAARSLVREAVLATQPEPITRDWAEPPARDQQDHLEEPDPSDRIASGHLLPAGLFLMLAIGCQPVLAFALLPYAGLVGWLLRRARRSGQVPEVLFFGALPLLAGGALLGAYNQVRFGSPFEFGSRYRLTLADFSAGPRLSRLLPGLGQHLLTPPVIDARFPFVHFPEPSAFTPATFFPSDGRTVGLLTLPLLAILLLLPLLPRLRRAFSAASRPVRVLVAVCTATGIAIAAYDSMALGATARSAIDFGAWLALAAAIAWLSLAEPVDNPAFSPSVHSFGPGYPHSGEKPEKRRPLPDAWFGLFLAAAGLTLLACAALFLQGENDRIRQFTPHVYEQLRRTLAFWLS